MKSVPTQGVVAQAHSSGAKDPKCGKGFLMVWVDFLTNWAYKWQCWSNEGFWSAIKFNEALNNLLFFNWDKCVLISDGALQMLGGPKLQTSKAFLSAKPRGSVQFVHLCVSGQTRDPFQAWKPWTRRPAWTRPPRWPPPAETRSRRRRGGTGLEPRTCGRKGLMKLVKQP